MFLDEFEKYYSQYEVGIRKIALRSTYPKILKELFDLKMEKMYGNYDLVFNQKGVLLHSVHFEKRQNYNIIYGYNEKCKLISAMKLVSKTNELISISEFSYDTQNRIETEIIRVFNFRTRIDVTEVRNHKYSINNEELRITSDNDEDDDHTVYYTYDNENRIIEEKAIRNSDELVWWHKNEYDNEGNIIKEISLGENGLPDGTTEYLPFDNGQTNGYFCSSPNIKYKREYSYTLNKKGHWTNQVVLIDGEPRYNYDRTIEYY